MTKRLALILSLISYLPFSVFATLTPDDPLPLIETEYQETAGNQINQNISSFQEASTSQSKSAISMTQQVSQNEVFQTTELQKLPIGLVYDRFLSPVVGASAVMTLTRGYEMLDGALIPSTEGDSSLTLMAGRFAKLVLIESLLADYAIVAQHEYFGHGFRLREFDVPVNHYKITPFSGYVSFNGLKYNALSLHEKAAIATGGMEGNTILAKQIRQHWLDSNVIDSREANLYLSASYDQTGYILNTKHHADMKNMGNDVISYVNTINQWYGSTVITNQKLRKQVLIDFFDPYFFYSLYSLGQYVVDGKQSFEYPMIPIGEYRYLPALRLALAPYGPEYQLFNIVKGPEFNLLATLRLGNTAGKHSHALGLEVTNIISSDLLFIDGKMDVWHQPKLFTSSAISDTDGHFGGALSLIARYRIAQQIDLFGQAGYKTTGYLPGEELKHSPILRVGFKVNI